MNISCLYLYAKVFLLLWFLESCDSFLLMLVLSLMQSRARGAHSSLGFLISTDWPRTTVKALTLTLLQPEAGQEDIPLLGMMVSHRRAGKGARACQMSKFSTTQRGHSVHQRETNVAFWETTCSELYFPQVLNTRLSRAWFWDKTTLFGFGMGSYFYTSLQFISIWAGERNGKGRPGCISRSQRCQDGPYSCCWSTSACCFLVNQDQK